MAQAFVSKQGRRIWLAARWCLVAVLAAVCATAEAQPAAVREGAGGRLIYERDQRGNRIPDFSHCGYAGADAEIPDVPVRVTVAPADGDDGERIQAAIDQVAGLPVGADGFRGAVLLAAGQYEVAGQLRIAASGVVLRGSGGGDGGTTLVATGQDRRALVRIVGADDRRLDRAKTIRVVDEYAPVGAEKLMLESTAELKVGDAVLVTRPSTRAWIKTLGMDAFGVGWRPGTRDIRWDRIVTAIDGDTIALDAPITTAIDAEYGGATVQAYDWPGRIEHVGVDDLRLESAHAADNPGDEDHAWHGVTIENAQNAWVRRVEFRHFAGGAVAAWESTKWVAVEDCIALAPVSELGGYRRHTFFTQGQLALFLRCWSEHGRHDFAVGHCAPGPNAFVNCFAAEAHDDSGPLESWASGVLFDNVRIDGAGLDLKNRWINPPGTGWSAANCVLWQCQAATMRCERPPTANNWAIGVWAGLSGDGTFAARSDFVRPISLYQGQLRERAGDARANNIGLGLVDPIGSTNPTIAEAAEFVAQSRRPARQLIDVIRERFRRPSTPRETGAGRQRTEYTVPGTGDVRSARNQLSDTTQSPSPTPDTRHLTPDSPHPTGRLAVKNGWLVIGGEPVTGGSIGQGFWRGSIRPGEAAEFGPAITRFVPGRVGTGFTDVLGQLGDNMLARGVAVFDHHYGLWYERRRDDHTMVRQENGDVAPPFYEQPFARTGSTASRAWNGLSKYDLTRFNPWYWQRLHDFARVCDERGLVLMHENYFQHNILEAGAHWADSPWRPANNVNDTGLPEPPPYVGDKRIFMARNFYDVTNPELRALHRGYIRQCLDNFADTSNVIQMTSAEYSGPLEFTRFWLDTIVEWEREQGAGGRGQRAVPRSVIISLSAPKDVQDAILEDPVRGAHVDVIDIRYWAYTADDGLYAPKGGQHLAPRQHLRQTRLKPGGFAAIVKAVREYRTRFPEKAVTYYADMHCPSGRDGWAVLMGGGSLANVKLPAELADVIPAMQPKDGVVAGSGQWCLGSSDGDCLIYSESAEGSITLHLPTMEARYHLRWIDPETGEVTDGGELSADGPQQIELQSRLLWVTRIGRSDSTQR